MPALLTFSIIMLAKNNDYAPIMLLRACSVCSVTCHVTYKTPDYGHRRVRVADTGTSDQESSGDEVSAVLGSS